MLWYVCVCLCVCVCVHACVRACGVMVKFNLTPNMRVKLIIICTTYVHACRIAYSVYLCEQLQRLFPNQKVQLMYDIACNLEKHLKVMSITTVTTGCFTVCVFHRPIIDVIYLAALSLQFPFFMPMDMSLLARYI